MASIGRTILFGLKCPISGRVRNGVAREIRIEYHDDDSIRAVRVTAVMDEDMQPKDVYQQTGFLRDALGILKDALDEKGESK